MDANNEVKEWAHHYEGDGCDPAAHVGETMGSVLITPADGTINVIGLDAGTYSLLEIEAPDGYNKLTAPVSVSINIGVDETNNEIKEMSGTVSQGTVKYTIDTATATVTIPNYQGNVLPSTGGIGTTLFYVIGGLLAAGAVVLLVTKKRMSAEN